MAHFTKLLFCPKKNFLASNFFMQMFSESLLCRQSIELFRHKLWHKLNSPYMHYLYTSYKIARLDKKPFCLKEIFCLTPLHAHAQYICIVYAKYRKASVKTLVYKLTFPCMHYLSKSKTSKQEKMAKFSKLSFCQKLIFWHETSSCKCSMCLYYLSTNKTLI